MAESTAARFEPFAEPPPQRAAPRSVLAFAALLIVAACVTSAVWLEGEQEATPQESNLPDPVDVAQVLQKKADEEAAEAFALQARKDTQMAMLQRASELASKGNLQASFDKHDASPAAKMSFVKHEKLLEEAAQLEAAAQTILHGKEGDSVMPDSFRIVDERLAAERAAFHNSQSHHKGRRLLGGGKKTKNASSQGKTNAKHKNKGDVLQEFFSGSTDCMAANGGAVKTVALKKGGGWTLIGGWKSTIKYRSNYANFIFLRLSSPQNKCNDNPNGVCMDYRYKDCGTEAARDAALETARENPRAAHSEGMKQGSGFPKLIGSVGQCFAKCKHVVWGMLREGWYRQIKSYREHESCETAHVLGCKADGGQNTGYIDVCTDKDQGCKPNKWRTCVKKKSGNWKAQ